MTSEPIFEMIDPDLEELMERFFINSKKDLVKMEIAVESTDFTSLAHLGHTAKGTGYGYGFTGMGDIGRDLEVAARNNDIRACADQVSRMEHYLENVEVRYGE